MTTETFIPWKRLRDIVENTSISLLEYKEQGLVEPSSVAHVMRQWEYLHRAIQTEQADAVDCLWSFVQKFGTRYLEDLLFVQRFRFTMSHDNFIESDKVRILFRYFRPFYCKIVPCYQLQRDFSSCQPLDCIPPEMKQPDIFRLQGLRLVLPCHLKDKRLLVHGVFDNILASSLSSQTSDDFLFHVRQNMMEQADKEGVSVSMMEHLLEGFYLSDCFLNLGESILWNFDIFDIIGKKMTTTMIGKSVWQDLLNKVEAMEQFVLHNKMETIVAKYNEMSSFDKIQFFRFLLLSHNNQVQYCTYMLYDLLTFTQIGLSTMDTTIHGMFRMLPWKLKTRLIHSVSNSANLIQQSIETNVSDVSKLSLEQQVYLLRVPEKVKEKALAKLKDIKTKSEELTGKSRQYLEALLRIPFGEYRQEPLLQLVPRIKDTFQRFFPQSPCKDLTTLRLALHTHRLELALERRQPNFWSSFPLSSLRKHATSSLRKKTDLYQWYVDQFTKESPPSSSVSEDIIWNQTGEIIKSIDQVKLHLQNIHDTLDTSVYGHKEAKRKLVQVIGSWLSNPERKQTGYALGFEGEPGIGKTSLANMGLSKCLQDEHGVPRPFHIIALGGSCNSSTLEGHNYTYSNSTWGRIVDILMESKCMNPIIYIDELDKVSKTENGKEIIGLLIHIIDSSTNAGFQDKYFSGIDIDLSQVLFVFSYNKPEDIDKILLDRIHRIPFDTLSQSDKLVIIRQHIIPSLEKSLGIETSTVVVDDATLEHLVDSYTSEAGIRKTKQLLFDIYSQINLQLLHGEVDPPIVLTPLLLEKDYLAHQQKIVYDTIHSQPSVGVMNALYATQNGQGGIIKIEAQFYPTNTLMEMKLTGSLGKVFTESMDICKNVAWNVLSTEIQQTWLERFTTTKRQGIHVHFGDCNTPKEGASASLASALTLYSLLVEKPLRNDMAMTGETNLSGEAKRVGGISAKFLGGMRAGIKLFFYPEENQQDVDDFFAKSIVFPTCQFFAIKNLVDVIHHPVGIFTN